MVGLNQRFERLLERVIVPRRYDLPFQTLLGGSESNAVVLVQSIDVIFAEISTFAPDREASVDEMAGIVPFHTTGDQWVVDLKENSYATREVEYKEGQIQGLVYALDALNNGVDLDNVRYEQFILDEAGRFADSAANGEYGPLHNLPEHIKSRLQVFGFMVLGSEGE